MKKEKSCGGIVFRKVQWTIEFLIVQSRKNNHWFFSKWHVEVGESEEQTALREIYEEVGLPLAIIPWFKEMFSYIDYTTPAEKTVVFFLCDAGLWQIIISDELQDVLWLDYEHALHQLTHDNSKILLTKAYHFLDS